MTTSSLIGIARIIAFTATLLAATCSEAATLQGRVTGVESGEQILFTASDGRRRKIKLLGIRIPSHSKTLFGDAKRHLAMLVTGRTVSVEYHTVLANGVILGIVRHGGADVAIRMLRAGLARVAVNPPLSHEIQQEYLASENLARSRRLGLWQ